MPLPGYNSTVRWAICDRLLDRLRLHVPPLGVGLGKGPPVAIGRCPPDRRGLRGHAAGQGIVGFKGLVVGRVEIRQPRVQVDFGQKGMGVGRTRIGCDGPLRRFQGGLPPAVEILVPGQPLRTLAWQHRGRRKSGSRRPTAQGRSPATRSPRPARHASRGQAPSSPRARSNHSDWATAGMPMPPVVSRSTSSTATPSARQASGGKVPLANPGDQQAPCRPPRRAGRS